MEKSMPVVFKSVLYSLIMCLALVLSSCTDSDLLEKFDKVDQMLTDHEARLVELEELCAQQNTNLESLHKMVEALGNNDYVKNIAEIKEGDNVIGYTITLSSGESLTIYNGKDGSDGADGKDAVAPMIGVKQDADGLWYWTLNGDWLLNSYGEKVRAVGLDGSNGQDGEDGQDGTDGENGVGNVVMPLLKIVGGYWYVSYDGGATWEDETLGPATGGTECSIFKNVRYDNDYVYITLAGGEMLTLLRAGSPDEENLTGLLDVSIESVTGSSITFVGKLSVPESELPFTEVVLYYSCDEQFHIMTARSASIISFDENKAFKLLVSGLNMMTKYNYCFYVKTREGETYGNLNSFETESAPNAFFVCGPATGYNALHEDLSMAIGLNEAAGNVSRKGMFEKYIVLEGGKEFEIAAFADDVKVRYSAILVDYDCTELADNPGIIAKKGVLISGDNTPAMKVERTGLYHIIVDMNYPADLLSPLIVVAPVEWGVRGGMNGWGFTAFPEVTYSNAGMTWTLENQELNDGGKFKFAYGYGWKISIDDAGNVKANTKLGEGAVSDATDIAVEKGGKYKITLTFALKGGAIENSYKYTVECIKESTMTTEMYIIGNDFGNWDWNAETVVAMTPVHSHSGAYWAIRYMTTDTQFKFCGMKEWNGDFCSLSTNTGFLIDNGCDMVEADGLYMIYVDVLNDFIAVEPAKVYGIGDAFGSWDPGLSDNLFAVEGQTLTITVPNSGNLRMYASAPDHAENVDWWQMEFNLYDGKIVYRGAGDDQPLVPVTAGQKVTLDSNSESGSIE